MVDLYSFFLTFRLILLLFLYFASFCTPSHPLAFRLFASATTHRSSRRASCSRGCPRVVCASSSASASSATSPTSPPSTRSSTRPRRPTKRGSELRNRTILKYIGWNLWPRVFQSAQQSWQQQQERASQRLLLLLLTQGLRFYCCQGKIMTTT